jgi:hypothetical protein
MAAPKYPSGEAKPGEKLHHNYFKSHLAKAITGFEFKPPPIRTAVYISAAPRESASARVFR